MPYDDDGSRLGWRDIEDIYSQYFSRPDQVSILRLSRVIETLTPLVRQRGAQGVDLKDVDRALSAQGLHDLPIGTVVGIYELVQQHSGHEDVVSQVSVRDLENVVKRVHQR